MSDLAVAHLTGRQADRFARCLEQRMRVVCEQFVEDGQLRQQDGIAVASGRFGVFVADAPPVANDQDKRLHPVRVRGRRRRWVRIFSPRLPRMTASVHRKPAR